MPNGFPVMALTPLRFANAHRFLAASESFFLPAAVSSPLLGASTFTGDRFEALCDDCRFAGPLRCTVFAAATADTDPFVGPSISRKAVMARSMAALWCSNREMICPMSLLGCSVVPRSKMISNLKHRQAMTICENLGTQVGCF